MPIGNSSSHHYLITLGNFPAKKFAFCYLDLDHLVRLVVLLVLFYAKKANYIV